VSRRTDHQRRNKNRASLHFNDEGGSWYALDNAAIIMPAVSSGAATYLFRISATLQAPVFLPALEAALARVARRFPYFVVQLGKGFFWHYLEAARKPLRVEADGRSPCQDFDMHRKGTILMRVRARRSTIACEFSHIITDGTGGMRFLKNLLAEYFRILEPALPGLDPTALAVDPDFYDLDEPPQADEMEDSYNLHYPEGFPFPPKEAGAWHIDGSFLPEGEYRTITASIPLEASLGAARHHGVSLTEFLAAVYFEALQELWLGTRPRPRRSHLAVEIPVNMRAFIPSRTSRNFSLMVHPAIDMRLGRRELPELISTVHHQARNETTERNLKRHIARNVLGGRAAYVRLLPLGLKSFLMRSFYEYFGMGRISGELSNLGPVRMPEALAGRIAHFDLVIAPLRAIRSGAALLSWAGELRITFSSLIAERELERRFFVRLQSLGLPVKVECNFEE